MKSGTIHAVAVHRAVGARRGQLGFTMVEVAISLAVIGFAMVAIMGVLPTGLNVQKSNREDTLVNQDGPYFLEAIRGGLQFLQTLTNNVDAIVVFSTPDNRSYRTNITVAQNYRWGRDVVGRLSYPSFEMRPDIEGDTKNLIPTYREVYAKVRAFGGSASLMGTNEDSRNFAFSYELKSEIIPYNAGFTNSLRILTGDTAAVKEEKMRLWRERQNVATNLYEVRLTMSWPIYGATTNWMTEKISEVGARINNKAFTRRGRSNQRVFRTLLAGPPLVERGAQDLFFFSPTNQFRR